MSNQKTHWKRLTNPDYIGAYTLMETGKAVDLTVTITSVGRKEVKGEDGKKDECTVAKLAGQKDFIINATNAKTITKLYGSPFIEDWIGKKITLFVDRVKIKGEFTEALRIRPTVPQDAKPTLPDLTPTHEKWPGAKTAVQAGNTTIEAIRKSYTLSADNEKLLTAK